MALEKSTLTRVRARVRPFPRPRAVFSSRAVGGRRVYVEKVMDENDDDDCRRRGFVINITIITISPRTRLYCYMFSGGVGRVIIRCFVRARARERVI